MRARLRLGRFPLIAFLAAIGLLVCAIANAMSRATLDPSPLIYWAGLLLIAVPIFFRLTSREASPRERLALVILLALTLYAVKVTRDPFAFGYSDEPVHAFNANQIAGQHELFGSNSILEVTPFYPGLEGATSALMTITGMSSFGAGLIIVGAARLLMAVGLFVLFRRIGGSAYGAGLGVATYVGSYNFLYFSAQYSYESLALPLLVFVLAAIAERTAAKADERRDWIAPLALAIAAVVVTHHLTSYGMAATLVLLAILYWALRIRGSGNPWPFAALAIGLTLVWLTVVASVTVGYLSPVLDEALRDTVDTITGEDRPRALFQEGGEGGGGSETPTIARLVAFSATLILFAGLLLGMGQLWKRKRRDPFALLFMVAGFGFFGTLVLRFIPSAWETGNRASGFLFIGLALVFTFARFNNRLYSLGRVRGRLLATSALAIVFAGGVVSGWPWNLHLSKPARATADGGQIESEPVGLGKWAYHHLPDQGFAATAADARQLLLQGEVRVQAGRSPNIEDIIADRTLASWQLPVLREENLRYVVTDLRDRAEDGLRGYALSLKPETGEGDTLLPEASARKFEVLYDSARILDSGRIVVYDLEARP